jgi:small-conductance mechanosensitive channel
MNFNTEFTNFRLFFIKNLPFLFVLIFILLPIFLKAQDTGDVDPSMKGRSENVAPVRMDGEILFYVRGVMSYPAELRAATIRSRIYKAAENRKISPDSTKIVKDGDKIKIYIGPDFIMNIYDVDAEIDGISKELKAEVDVEKIKAIIKTYRHERTPLAIRAAVFKTVVATILLIICLVIFIWLFRRLNAAFNVRIKKKIDKLENVSFKIIQSVQLLKVLHVAYKVVRTLIILFIIIGFADYILTLFPWTKSGAYFILNLFLDPFKSFFRRFLDYLPSLIFLIIIYITTQYLIKLIKLFFIGIDNGGIVIDRFDPEWAMPTFKIVRFLVIVLASVVAFPYIPGSGTSAFQGISVFLGVLFSLGSSSFISNVIAGYSMTYRRAFKKGDRIKVNEYFGSVEEQSLMVTRLRSVKNEEIIIPNSVMLNSSVFNYSHMPPDKGIILHTTVGIGYETPWRQVYAMLKLAADRTEGLVKDPPPYVFTKTLGDFAVVYEINAYCFDVLNMYKIYTELHQHILDIFNENNVQIMTPAYEGDPETPKVVPKEQWHTPLAGDQKPSE